MMIGGIPNVGKSTIINSLRKKEESISHSKRSGAKVGAVPCITKSFSGFKVMENPLTYLIDSPGIIQPKIHDNEDGL
ncbi:MAG: 50S ribosome-binding GTPase [Streptococcus sp.]|nr:50S ribosome-binding GTPase [Streptococcus sp.]